METTDAVTYRWDMMWKRRVLGSWLKGSTTNDPTIPGRKYYFLCWTDVLCVTFPEKKKHTIFIFRSFLYIGPMPCHHYCTIILLLLPPSGNK